ncbi:MAG: sigma-70 family RNA polymerase sigma factor [Bacteroidales bacterium]|nr:sigma-70 family RNA polymerase sigma factor [Bacteroidales bacterium]
MKGIKEQEAIALIRENRNLVFKICTMYTNSKDDMDDLFQEICIQLWKSYPSFKSDSKVSTWMYRVALNTAISWIRKEKKYQSNGSFPNSEVLINDDFPFYLEAEKQEQIKWLYQAIESLSKFDKTLVLLYLEEVPYPEIAEILGITEVNVRVKMNRIRTKLKKVLSNESI